MKWAIMIAMCVNFPFAEITYVQYTLFQFSKKPGQQ
jgi:hypothetical protein